MTATVLIVDDDRETTKLVVDILQLENHKTLTAHDHHEASRILEQKPIDLIILDFCLPEISGLEYCEKLQWSKSYREIPVIISSVEATTELRKKAQRAGAKMFVPKPFNITELLDAIRTLSGSNKNTESRPVFLETHSLQNSFFPVV